MMLRKRIKSWMTDETKQPKAASENKGDKYAMEKRLKKMENMLNEIRTNEFNFFYTLLRMNLSMENRLNDMSNIMLGNKTNHIEHILRIWKLLRIKRVKDTPFIRVGAPHDGGYVMLDDLKGSVAYSFGISNDVSWDDAMTEHGYDIYMYDFSIKELPYKKKQFHFFKKGIASSIPYDTYLNTLENFMEKNGHRNHKNMILKMDVEGAEWGFFNMVKEETLCQFDQIVMEWHNLNSNDWTENIIKGMEKVYRTHTLVHVHANNYCNVTYYDGKAYPDTIEIVLANNAQYDFEEIEVAHLPIPEDAPNWMERSDIILGNVNEP